MQVGLRWLHGAGDLQPVDLHLLGWHQLSSDGDEWVVLQECENTIEVTGVRTVLEAHGIKCLTHGENQSYFAGPFGDGLLQPKVLVAQRELERARALLEAESVSETTGAPLEGCVCPVHEEAATSTCPRCGTFLCAACPSEGSPPVCETCVEVERLPPRGKASGRQAALFFLLLAVVFTLVLTRSLWLR